MVESAHTGSMYGTRGWRWKETSSTRTSVDYQTVDNPVLRDVLPAFDDALLDEMVDPALTRPAELLSAALAGGLETIKVVLSARGTVLLLTTSAVDPHELPARDAVMFVAGVLGVPQRDVLKTAGIAQRTFHTWGKVVRQPRLNSQGRLWELVQLAEDLREVLGDRLPLWMRAPGRRALLADPDPQQLLSQALLETTTGPTGARRLLSSAVGSEPTGGVASDVTRADAPAGSTRTSRPGPSARPAQQARPTSGNAATPAETRTRRDARDA